MAKLKTKTAPAKAPKPEAEPKEAKTVQEGELNRRVKPSYRWIAADVVREAGDGADTGDLIKACHAAAKDAGLDAKEDTYWSRRLTRARSLLRKAGLGVFTTKRIDKPKSEKVDRKLRKAKGNAKHAGKVAKASADEVYEEA